MELSYEELIEYTNQLMNKLEETSSELTKTQHSVNWSSEMIVNMQTNSAKQYDTLIKQANMIEKLAIKKSNIKKILNTILKQNDLLIKQKEILNKRQTDIMKAKKESHLLKQKVIKQENEINYWKKIASEQNDILLNQRKQIDALELKR